MRFTRRQRLVLGVLVFSQLLVWIDTTILGLALEILADPARGFGAAPSDLQWAIGAYTLTFATLMFAAGALGDRFGHRRTLVAGMAVFGAASLGAAYADGPGQLIAARALMGVGGALVMPASMAVLTWVFPGEARAAALGIFSASSGVGLAAGPIVAGLLLQRFWWGSIFLINVPVAVLGIVGVLLVVPECRPPAGRRFDPAGLVLSAAGLGLVSYGLISAGRATEFDAARVLGPVLAGAALLAAFVAVELRLARPSFDPRLFRRRHFAAGHLALAAVFLAVAGHGFVAAFYLQGARGFTPLAAGLAGAPSALGVMLGAPLATRLARRWSARPVTAAAMTAAAAFFALFGTFGLHTALVWYEIVVFAQGFTIGMVIAPVTSAVLRSLPLEQAGAAAAVNNTVRQVGGLLGIALIGAVLAIVYRHGVADAVSGLAPDLRERAAVSAESARDVAASGRAPGLAAAADAAFVRAMRVCCLWTAAVLLAGAAVLGALLRVRAAAPARGEAAESAAAAG
ncbi:MFS transporter [Actinomadura atramentaria]|uniref:MFS transporter n=1 Tax=Actinomadura atramentaria TaxID=1990 RepID=UPI00036810EA|nr:MFS transporter [Actinomadura atramentaria]